MPKHEQPTLPDMPASPTVYPPDVPLTIEEFQAWADSATWRFAKTAAEVPHEYTVFPSQSDETLRSVWGTIKEHGERRMWPPEGSPLHGTVRPRPYIYLTVGEYEYWRTTYMVNRGRLGRVS